MDSSHVDQIDMLAIAGFQRQPQRRIVLDPHQHLMPRLLRNRRGTDGPSEVDVPECTVVFSCSGIVLDMNFSGYLHVGPLEQP